MRLCIATPLYPPEPGGPATYAKLLEDELPGRGIEVVLVKFSDVRHLPRLVRHFAYFLRVYQAAHRADAVLVQDTVSCGIPALFAARLARKPFLVRVPGDYAWEQARQRFGITASLDEFQTMNIPWRAGILSAMQRMVVRNARLVIVPSKYFASIVSEWGVPSERLAVLYHGITFPLETVLPASLPSQPFMVSSGRLVPWKGFSGLIQLLSEMPGWKLVIVGDGPDREQLEVQVGKNKVEDRVLFTGALPRAEALGWCAAADAFVLNTSFESFSFQIVEAMSLGVPVVATSVGSIPELIENGKEGVLVSPDDLNGFHAALESVQTEPEAWKNRKEAAQKKALEFSVARMIEGTAERIQKAV